LQSLGQRHGICFTININIFFRYAPQLALLTVRANSRSHNIASASGSQSKLEIEMESVSVSALTWGSKKKLLEKINCIFIMLTGRVRVEASGSSRQTNDMDIGVFFCNMYEELVQLND